MNPSTSPDLGGPLLPPQACAEGHEVSYAKCDDVKSISEQRLIARLGVVSDAVTFEITRILRFLLDI